MVRSSRNFEPESRYVIVGTPTDEGPDNSVTTSKYTLLTFFPIAIREQFRRNGNVYFLVMGTVMWLGTYTPLFDSALEPWTTLGPLAGVVAISLLQEGLADMSRHRSDGRTNAHPCRVLCRSDISSAEVGGLVGSLLRCFGYHADDTNNDLPTGTPRVVIRTVRRDRIHAGRLVVLKNREVIPADVVLLASSNDQGSVYIETSSIDGETNLKLRLRASDSAPIKESMEDAIARISFISALSRPNGISALKRPQTTSEDDDKDGNSKTMSSENTVAVGDVRFMNLSERVSRSVRNNIARSNLSERGEDDEGYVAVLSSELPNASVNTFSGVVTLDDGEKIPVDADHLLLRGAVLRNTEWAIGVACFTGRDTKLVQNAVQTPSKFSSLDVLINRTVICIIFVMILLCLFMAASAVHQSQNYFPFAWYLGYVNESEVETKPWPYLPNLPPPEWKDKTDNFSQMFLSYLTLTNNFVPLSLYITIELVTAFFMLMINWDLDMYHTETDTPAAARSTIVSDLGQVSYVFSDKTGTLTQNVMRFVGGSVDGTAYGSNSDDANDDHIRKDLSTLRNQSTFNVEMFLRVMCLCHTVVVERDFDDTAQEEEIDDMGTSGRGIDPLNVSRRVRNAVKKTLHQRLKKNTAGGSTTHAPKVDDGAPKGFAYQAESPDEGALVSAASLHYGYQLLSRESNGLRIQCPCPPAAMRQWMNQDSTGVARRTAAQPAQPPSETYEETWQILAVNKFDSDRKRMSVLLRSPPGMGSLPVLFCKGADSSMICPGVCDDRQLVQEDSSSSDLQEGDVNADADEDFQIHAHLGDFASEGLRTLVLGVRILSESETSQWLAEWKEASASLVDRNDLLRKAALSIEKKLHIVGATAIEDRLQDGVPETVAALAKARINLWVLTGDKRETAIEIGYSTKVLTPRMALTEIADDSLKKTRYRLAREFMALVKSGELRRYQKDVLNKEARSWLRPFVRSFRCLFGIVIFCFRLVMFVINLAFKIIGLVLRCGCLINAGQNQDATPLKKPRAFAGLKDTIKSRWAVRRQAEALITEYKNSAEFAREKSLRKKTSSQSNDNGNGDDDDDENFGLLPSIFRKSAIAKAALSRRSSGTAMAGPGISPLMEAPSYSNHQSEGNIDVDMSQRSQLSVVIGPSATSDEELFDKRKRTTLELLFSVDEDVQQGRLVKHLKKTQSDEEYDLEGFVEGARQRALVIEGGALLHLLGDPIMEEMLFAVADRCSSVIACRASPKQKALLVNLVRNYVQPEPVTLAIGDGANDVGMIQEAHVGVGISGLEGQQAVNASDFAIAQFRFLRELLLIHGRWNFIRMSKVVLFSFYKNATLVICLCLFSIDSLSSSTGLFDQWVISMLNFVASLPIIAAGLFDRDLEKEYIRAHPEVFNATRNNEFMSARMVLRYVLVTIIHGLVIYFLGLPAQSLGGGQTPGSSWNSNFRTVGDGEGGDLKTVGVTLYTALVLTLAWKALYETRTVILPRLGCKRWWHWFGICIDNGDIGWTFHAWFFGSVFFWILGAYLYSYTGSITDNPEWIPFAKTAEHAFGFRVMTWVLNLFVPVVACATDVVFKAFANTYFPTQTQIHMEINSMKSSSSSKRPVSVNDIEENDKNTNGDGDKASSQQNCTTGVGPIDNV